MASNILTESGIYDPTGKGTSDMTRNQRGRQLAALGIVAALTVALALPASALFFAKEEEEPAVVVFAKNGLSDEAIYFSDEDFMIQGNGQLESIVITKLPDTSAGFLTLGAQALAAGDTVEMTAVQGLCFTPAMNSVEGQTSFTFSPKFKDGKSGPEVEVGIYLLKSENSAPIAENLSFSTYKNVALTERLSAVDAEGDLITYRLLDKPARGSVEITEKTGEFVYTPYENKTGKDSFTYVAMDAVGNTSAPATVKMVIEKPSTKVSYSDMEGDPAHKAAIRLAEEGIYVGACVGGEYFFDSDAPVSRSEFLTMTMKAAGVDPMESVTRTGFVDDEDIPTWAKGYVSAALQSGLVEGQIDEDGQVLFRSANTISKAEASVMLNRALQIQDTAVSASYSDSALAPSWALQSATNLAVCGVLKTNVDSALALDDTLTRGEAAQLLCAGLELLDNRDSGGVFS